MDTGGFPRRTVAAGGTMGRLTRLDKQVITGLGALLAVTLCAGVLSVGEADPPLETRATDTAAGRAQALGQTRPPGTTAPQEEATQQEATQQEEATEPTPSVKPKSKPKPQPEPTATKTKTAPKKKPKPRPTRTKTKPAEVSYANCAAVRAAGADPIRAGDPGYSRKLDRDGDGVGCE
jgi:outer membrane biosynthesis protein TonB